MSKIKSISLLLMLVLSFAFSSCCKEDDAPEDLIVGEWEMTYSAGWEMVDGITTEWSEPREGVFWVFYHDGKGYVQDYTIPNNRPAFFEWRISDKRLIVNSSGEVFVYDIRSLRRSEMLIDVSVYDVNYEGRWTETFTRVR